MNTNYKKRKKVKRRISIPRISGAIICIFLLSKLAGNLSDIKDKKKDNIIFSDKTLSQNSFNSESDNPSTNSAVHSLQLQHHVAETTTITTTPEPKNKNILNVDVLYQKPELPTGCEVTSLTMLLNYMGFEVDKVTLADKYLAKDYTATVGFDKAFIGDPKWENGYGCFAPVIVDTAQKYLNSQNSSYKAVDISGTELEELYKYIDLGKPVIIWNSMYQLDLEKYFCYYDDYKRPIYWYSNEHCMLLIGYDKTTSTVTVADPLSGLKEYETHKFKSLYDTLEKQAVIIE